MPKLLQIDSCLGIYSTGHISEGIAEIAIQKGWDCYIAHGARYVGNTIQNSYQITSRPNEYLHYAESLLLDRHGLGSRIATKKLIEKIKGINPDVIQLHCIHGYYINYQYLFEFLNTTDIPVIWTFHDCWAFTGHCTHFATCNCNKWKLEGCNDCPQINSYPKALFDNSKKNYELKKRLFCANKNLHIVSVSKWLASYTKESFLCKNEIRVINNGIDISKFAPCLEQPTNSKFAILGVASAWGINKGLFDFYKLREILSADEYDITLVGLSQKQINQLPKGIKGITRTNSVSELAQVYSASNVFVNPTYADSFPTVNMEALACGTPVITYHTGGSPEIIDEKTGVVVKQGDIQAIADVVKGMRARPLSSSDCRKRAEKLYDKNERFKDYVELYEELIKN